MVLVFLQRPCHWPPETCLFSAPRPSLRPVCSDLCLLACPVQAGLKQPLAYLMSRPVPSSALPPCWRKPQPHSDQALRKFLLSPFHGAFLQLRGPIIQLLSNRVEELGLPGGPGAASAADNSHILCGQARAHVCMYMHACKTSSCVTVYICYLL